MTVPTAAVWRPVDGRLVVKIPRINYPSYWLRRQIGSRSRPSWNAKSDRWEIARHHLRPLVEAMADRFAAVDVFIDSRAITKCDTRCRDAEGDDCDCQCLGENHGGAAYWRDWRLVSDTTLVTADGVSRRHMRVVRRPWPSNR